MGSAFGFGGLIANLVIIFVVLLILYRIVKLAVNRSEIKEDITKLRAEVKNLHTKINNLEKSDL
ncbi:hypothetical protein [Paenibacillus lactis]|uniref:Uncharacterized protein n=1 Tax=Paenibacillus lactis 154 TaxID=743719 RepID=G4HP99_9BACL|nr:hypothetical protein [Paenibacillus lactis]EHB48936.1 hypothetical protein PaelaDRAFT_5810 [Paenibacillus lactis 154]